MRKGVSDLGLQILSIVTGTQVMLLKHTGMIHEQKDLPHNFLSVSKL